VRLLMCAVGRMKAGPERQLVLRYGERLASIGRALALGPLSIVEVDESRARLPQDRKAEEAQRLLEAAGATTIIALDETGTALTSEALAARIGRFRDEGAQCLSFLIGGADGHGEAVRSHAALILSFGALTWPHELVRALVAEQLYRAATILAGHPYHRH
jgi:23S rRNA (pseudouridine1915-N3)-methyltransferase